jgi:hypothetical protein
MREITRAAIGGGLTSKMLVIEQGPGLRTGCVTVRGAPLAPLVPLDRANAA